jgi:hypothetical protein
MNWRQMLARTRARQLAAFAASRLEELSFEDHPGPEDSAAPRFRATYSSKKL